MEKRVSTLTTGSATIQLEALREILKIYLFGRPSLAMEMYQAGRTNEPPLSSGIEAEIVAWEWYFDRLAQLIRSSQMQLRVYAATSMCTSLVNIWRRFSDASDEEERTRLLNRIGSYLLQTNLVNYIFGPNCHPEIILESANIVGFLVINKQYGAEHTEQLWHTITNTQDPRVAEALCRMVTNIATLFDYEGLLGLCMKLQTLPIRSFTPAIRQLWTAVLKSMTDKVHANNAVMSFHPYQLCLQLLRESSVCTNGGSVLCPELQSTALQGLREVLEVGDEETRRQHRQQLFLSCLQDLEAKSNTTLGSLWALSLAIRPAVAAELSLLTEQHELTRLVVEELHHAVQSSQTAGTTSVLCGAPNHPRREFVAQIIQHEPLTLEGKLGTRLWDVLVGHQAACQMDRNAGWDILNSSVRKLSFKNHYLDTCFTDRLPALPRSCFCQGVLEFVRAQVLPLAGDINGSFFEDDAVAGRVGLEQLWRIVTAAEDNKLAEMAIHTLSAEVYLDSPLIQTFPISRTRQLHSSVVTRCLKLLRESARNLRSEDLASNPRTELKSSNEASLQDREDSQRIFDRTIQLLGNFLARYRAKPTFALPDLRSFMPEAPSQVEGDLTQLKYQSFDGRSQTDVKPLNIGKLNTAASLLASLRQETGFDNYRAFYRGRPFAPTEDDIRKSLEDLQVRDGLILVKKEADELRSHSRVKAGSSPLEVEISGHFDELQSYLDLAEPMARQVGTVLSLFGDMLTYKDSRFPHNAASGPAVHADLRRLYQESPRYLPAWASFQYAVCSTYPDAISGCRSEGNPQTRNSCGSTFAQLSFRSIMAMYYLDIRCHI
jgi:ubiquitin carboxyl-terminal hydrolase 34